MAFRQPNFAAAAIAAAKAHAVACYPEESCGLIVGPPGQEVYVACRNIAENPREDFHIDAQDQLAAGSALVAVVHSHPDKLARPSAADMRSQIATGLVWGIIALNAQDVAEPVWWGDFCLEQPLVGRSFVHGVNDCYSLIRAYYWQERRVMLPEFPRDAQWWHEGGDIYRDGFGQAGFIVIKPEEARPQDVFLGQVRSRVPNHGGIMLAGGLALHHLDGRLSRREPVTPWLKYITHWLRFVGLPE